MELLQNGVDRSVISLWLGYERPDTTQMYFDANLKIKEQALARTKPFGVQPGRYRPDDQIMAFLKEL